VGQPAASRTRRSPTITTRRCAGRWRVGGGGARYRHDRGDVSVAAAGCCRRPCRGGVRCRRLAPVFGGRARPAVGGVRVPYWSQLSEFAAKENPDVKICIELHQVRPSTTWRPSRSSSRSVRTFTPTSIPATSSGCRMDADRVVDRIMPRIGHVHAKDVTFNADALGLNGLLDHRWPASPEKMPWNFSVPGPRQGRCVVAPVHRPLRRLRRPGVLHRARGPVRRLEDGGQGERSSDQVRAGRLPLSAATEYRRKTQ